MLLPGSIPGMDTISPKTLSKEYHKSYGAKHYAANKELYKSRARTNTPLYIERNREYVRNIKLASGCVKCGYNEHHVCLDFHHLDSEDKDDNVARLVNSASSIKRIDKEIAKCIILCANCHRLEHYGGD